MLLSIFAVSYCIIMKRNTPPQEEPQGSPISMQQQTVDIKQ